MLIVLMWVACSLPSPQPAEIRWSPTVTVSASSLGSDGIASLAHDGKELHILWERKHENARELYYTMASDVAQDRPPRQVLRSDGQTESLVASLAATAQGVYALAAVNQPDGAVEVVEIALSSPDIATSLMGTANPGKNKGVSQLLPVGDDLVACYRVSRMPVRDQIWCRRRPALGGRWTPPTPVGGRQFPNQDHVGMAAGSKARLTSFTQIPRRYPVVRISGSPPSFVKLSKSGDHGYPAVDEDNELHMVWVDQGIHYAHCAGQDGATCGDLTDWSVQAVVHGEQPALVVSGNGADRVLWLAYQVDDTVKLAWRCLSADSWTISDMPAEPAERARIKWSRSAMVLDPSTRSTHIVYTTASAGEFSAIRLATARWPTCGG